MDAMRSAQRLHRIFSLFFARRHRRAPFGGFLSTILLAGTLTGTLTGTPTGARAESEARNDGTIDVTTVESPDGRNAISLHPSDSPGQPLRFTIARDSRLLIGPSVLGPVLDDEGAIGEGAAVVDVQRRRIDESFVLPWGKCNTVAQRCATASVTLKGDSQVAWQVELRAYDDGVAFRYRLLPPTSRTELRIRDEATQFDVRENPLAMANTLESFTTSHESLYNYAPLDQIASDTLLDMPLLLVWPDGTAAALTEGRLRQYAGMYLQRSAATPAALQCRLSPFPGRGEAAVVGPVSQASPWRVVLLADAAGKLLESNLLLSLNDPPSGDFTWTIPGKSTFHWWPGEFEDDYQTPDGSSKFLARHKAYIDFCADNQIAYHAVSGDGMAWYKQSPIYYGTPAPDADVTTPRAEIQLPEIVAYARERGVGIRLWVHWKPLSEQLEEAFSAYEAWGVKGLMVDFLDRDDQQMLEWVDQMLESAARHKLHIQIHGSSKFSGEQRTYPHLFNREGVLNLEYSKWSDFCTPAHSVHVAYTRALAGPVDFHLGGFRAVSRAEFKPRDRAPVVMGSRCHHLALYVVYENPMPFVADAPSAYTGQTGFDFVTRVPTTWDETRYAAGEPGEYVVVARRKGTEWYLGGITNWTPRQIDVPLDFLGDGERPCRLYVDGSLDGSQPNEVQVQNRQVTAARPLRVKLGPGGGFVAIVSVAP